nr:TauD/TfdA family dioxygenase [Sphingomonas sp.]
MRNSPPPITSSTITVTPITPRIGAFVDLLNPAAPIDHSADDLIRALEEHLVLVLRNQTLDAATIKRLGDRLGPMDADAKYGVPEHPEVRRFSSDTTSDHVLSEEWHSDSSWLPEPPIVSGLYLDTVPPMGGMLAFASMYSAHDALSTSMQTYLADLSAMHDGRLSRYKPSIPDPTAIHPVIRAHPVTGRKALYVNSVFTDRIVGVSPQESRAILDFLFDHIANAYFQVRFEWEPGTLVLWDNRCTQHLSIWNCPPRACAGYRIQIEDRTGSL